ncbi:hypothetical protein ACFWXA_29600 [Streptomyces atroolivaceus]|uniref:hypothetical protein n=1 Tax=Streptomyces atroolivaceus TaxID=66869 RepID=UPI003655D233
MSFCEHTSKEGWNDWELAHLEVRIRSLARYGGMLQAEVEPRMRLEFTADEVRRIDVFLAASLPDTGRLTAIEKNAPGHVGVARQGKDPAATWEARPTGFHSTALAGRLA